MKYVLIAILALSGAVGAVAAMGVDRADRAVRHQPTEVFYDRDRLEILAPQSVRIVLHSPYGE